MRSDHQNPTHRQTANVPPNHKMSQKCPAYVPRMSPGFLLEKTASTAPIKPYKIDCPSPPPPCKAPSGVSPLNPPSPPGFSTLRYLLFTIRSPRRGLRQTTAFSPQFTIYHSPFTIPPQGVGGGFWGIP